MRAGATGIARARGSTICSTSPTRRGYASTSATSPPGTSKWNKIEHRLFCHITQNWRGKPLRTFETIVDLIGNTRTDAGLRVKAKLDKRKYPTGEKVTKAEMDALSLHRNEFCGDWNYELHPR